MIVCFLAGCSSSPRSEEAKPRCAGEGTYLLVATKPHQLLACSKGRAIHQMPVALGRGGVGKSKEGDNKTPLGTYSLSSPRASSRFGIFVPIGYPTADQAKAGLTGSDVGIHGPARLFKWAGSLNLLFDWTQGCIAVESDEQIKTLSDWIGQVQPPHVVIE